MITSIEMVAELTKSGITQQQADAIVRVAASAQENTITREYMEARLSSLESRLEAKFESRLGDAKTSIVMWVGGMMAGQLALLIAIIKMLGMTA